MSRRPGRRSGPGDTRAEILTAARGLFAAEGFDRTTLRRVAETAGVDVALISHYFGSKRGLFLAAVDFPADPDQVLRPLQDCPEDELAATMLRQVLTVWDSPTGPAVLARFRQAVVTGETDLARGLLTSVILGPVRERIGAYGQTELRLSLFASQVGGLLLTRHIFGLDALREADIDTLVDAVAPNLQRYLTGDL